LVSGRTRGRRQAMGRRPLIHLVFLTLLGAVAACDRAPSPAGLPDWSPADHDQEPGRPPRANAKQGARTADAGGTAALVEVAWRAQCTKCHGPEGRGDGPEGAIYKAADLAASKATDEEIATTIRKGKGKMPKFDLPDDVVTGLVARVRSFRGK
jgi:mono/diheme cytochrome c family protein